IFFVSPGFTERPATSPAHFGDDAHMPPQLWNRNMICVLLAILLRSLPFFAFVGVYVTFLMTELHFPLLTAAAALSLFGAGPLLSPLAGYIADRTNQKTFQITCLFTMAITGFLIFNVAKTPFAQ